MKKLMFLCIITVLIFENVGKYLFIKPHLDGRIVGGEATTIEEYPYQVSLEVYGSHNCGGSIISPNVILTAAHCTTGYSLKSLKIRAGTTTRGKNGVVRKIEKVYIHEDYNFSTIDYDVSLIVLQEPLELSPQIQPIALPKESDYLKANETAVASGWGALHAGALLLPKTLQKVEVPIVDQELCNEVYSNGITPRMICAGLYGQGGKDACQGDSGGPLVSNKKIHGIVSWGLGCAQKRYPGVYTRVTAVREWIRSKVDL